MLQVKEIYEQHKLTNNAKREMKLSGIDGIVINNVELLHLIPIELHSSCQFICFSVFFSSSQSRLLSINTENRIKNVIYQKALN